MGIVSNVRALVSAEEAARVELERLQTARERLGIARRRAQADLIVLRAELPEIELMRVLEDGPPSDKHRSKITTLTAALETADVALTGVVARQRSAYGVLFAERAKTITRRADDVAKTRVGLQERVAEAQRALETVAECEYCPLSELQGTFFHLASGPLVSGSGRPARRPKVSLLAWEEAQLRDQAAGVLASKILESGSARAETFDGILRAVAEQVTIDNLMIGPTPAEVKAAFTDARIAAARALWDNGFEAREMATHGSQSAIHEHRMVFQITWTAGQINAAATRVYCEPRAASGMAMSHSQ